ncbi:hypothetical protein BDK51DRAFT_31739, partial [Blyttiomyces helicus]
ASVEHYFAGIASEDVAEDGDKEEEKGEGGAEKEKGAEKGGGGRAGEGPCVEAAGSCLGGSAAASNQEEEADIVDDGSRVRRASHVVDTRQRGRLFWLRGSGQAGRRAGQKSSGTGVPGRRGSRSFEPGWDQPAFWEQGLGPLQMFRPASATQQRSNKVARQQECTRKGTGRVPVDAVEPGVLRLARCGTPFLSDETKATPRPSGSVRMVVELDAGMSRRGGVRLETHLAATKSNWQALPVWMAGENKEGAEATRLKKVCWWGPEPLPTEPFDGVLWPGRVKNGLALSPSPRRTHFLLVPEAHAPP